MNDVVHYGDVISKCNAYLPIGVAATTLIRETTCMECIMAIRQQRKSQVGHAIRKLNEIETRLAKLNNRAEPERYRFTLYTEDTKE